jgi:hypothetical protein
MDRCSPVNSLGIDTISTILAAGLIFLLAPVLGIWKYRQRATSENHRAHPTPALTVGMIALIIGEVGGFAVLLAGCIAGQLF